MFSRFFIQDASYSTDKVRHFFVGLGVLRLQRCLLLGELDLCVHQGVVAATARRRRDNSLVNTQVKFAQKQAALQAKNAKPDKKVTDFVRRIRRVLDKKSREHGGTEGTYLRECFLNWVRDAASSLNFNVTWWRRHDHTRVYTTQDADCSGTIDAIEFRKAIRSLGLDISQADASYLVGYYGGVESAYTSVSQNEMTYDLLIEDVVNASIHFLQPQPPIPASARPDGPFPPVLRRFIKKVRQKLFTYITGKGENEQYLVRNAFLNWDKDASGKLDYGEFRTVTSVLHTTRVHLTMTWEVIRIFAQATPCGSSTSPCPKTRRSRSWTSTTPVAKEK